MRASSFCIKREAFLRVGFFAEELGSADFAAARTSLGLAIGTNVQAYDADLTTYGGITPSANVQTLLGSADFAAVRTNLALTVGTNVQAYDADLTTYGGITPSANVQTLLGSADFATARTNLGLAIGTNVQAYDADLTTLGALDGTSLTRVRPMVAVSTSGITKTLVASTEQLVLFSTITTVAADSDIFVMGNVFLYTVATAANPNLRLRRSAAGGACTTGSTLVYTFSGQQAATANLPLTLNILALDTPGAGGTYVYCVGAFSAAADVILSRNLAVMEVNPASTVGKNP